MGCMVSCGTPKAGAAAGSSSASAASSSLKSGTAPSSAGFQIWWCWTQRSVQVTGSFSAQVFTDKRSQSWIGDWWEGWGFACDASDLHRLTQSHADSYISDSLTFARSDSFSLTQIYSDSFIPAQIHSVSSRSTQSHSDLL